jgi:hypothetical protein
LWLCRQSSKIPLVSKVTPMSGLWYHHI